MSFGNPGPRGGEAQNPHGWRSSGTFPQSLVVWVPGYLQVSPHCLFLGPRSTPPKKPGGFRALPAADQLSGDAGFIFHQDLVPAHAAEAASTWFEDRGNSGLQWPANMPDLN